MCLYARIFRAIRNWFWPRRGRNFTLEVDTLRTLQLIASQEKRTPEEIANQYLDEALRDLQAQEENWRKWQSLSPREKEIAALICLHYTSRQAAVMLEISPETIKTHVEHILVKFKAADRNMLRRMLNGWDFSQWDQ